MKIATLWSTPKLLALTLLTIVSIVGIASAMLLATFYGGVVQVVSITGSIEYARTNDAAATLSTELLNVPLSGAWYVRFKTTTSGYQGSVNITWTLQKHNGTQYVDTTYTQLTTVTLTGASGQIIYASSNGAITNNKNWGTHCDTVGMYRIKAVFESA